MIRFQLVVDFIRELYNEPKSFIPLHSPVFKGNEKKYLKECIDTTFVSSVGTFVDQFEVEIANYTGAKKAIACVNGTSALHLALKLAGVEPGHEVLTQPLTFVATANAITYCGAQPVFLDVDIDTMGLSPAKLEAWLKKNVVFKKSEHSTHKTNRGEAELAEGKPETRNPKRGTRNAEPFNKFTGNLISACVPMHTFGHPCRIEEIVEICDHYYIPVIEDAAESLGSFYSPRKISLINKTGLNKATISRGKKQHTGTFGKIGVLSFNGNKIITTGSGGMLLFKDEELAKHAKHLTTQAKVPHPWEFAHDETGYNYRMPNINAALGLAQLEQLDSFLASKKEITMHYKQFFKSIDIPFITEPENASSNCWLNCILLKDKTECDTFLKYTNENGVMTRPAWRLMSELPMFRNCLKDDLKNATTLAEKLVNIPSSAIIK